MSKEANGNDSPSGEADKVSVSDAIFTTDINSPVLRHITENVANTPTSLTVVQPRGGVKRTVSNAVSLKVGHATLMLV